MSFMIRSHVDLPANDLTFIESWQDPQVTPGECFQPASWGNVITSQTSRQQNKWLKFCTINIIFSFTLPSNRDHNYQQLCPRQIPAAVKAVLSRVQSGRWDIINIMTAAAWWRRLWFLLMSVVGFPKRRDWWLSYRPKLLGRVSASCGGTRHVSHVRQAAVARAGDQRNWTLQVVGVNALKTSNLLDFNFVKYQVVLTRGADGIFFSLSLSLKFSSPFFSYSLLGLDLKYHLKWDVGFAALPLIRKPQWIQICAFYSWKSDWV